MRLIVAAVVLASSVANAQAPTAGAKLFEEGRELAKQGKYAEACDRFEKSYALDNGVGTELNLADCHEHLGHYAAAWRMFQEAAERSADNPTRLKFAQGRAQTLAGKLATAVVKLSDPTIAGISVTVNGRGVKPAAEIDERVDPGSIAVHVVVPGKPAWDKTMSAAAGATVVFEVPGGAPATTGTPTSTTTATTTTATTTTAAPTEPMRPESPATERRHSRVVVAYSVGAFGVAALGVGIGLGLKARSDYNDAIQAPHCQMIGNQLLCDLEGYTKSHDAGTLADVGTIFGAVGAATILAGAIVYFTAPRDVVVAPMASAGSAGVQISGTF